MDDWKNKFEWINFPKHKKTQISFQLSSNYLQDAANALKMASKIIFVTGKLH